MKNGYQGCEIWGGKCGGGDERSVVLYMVKNFFFIFLKFFFCLCLVGEISNQVTALELASKELMFFFCSVVKTSSK